MSNGTLTFQKLKRYLEEISNADLVLIQFEIPIQTVISIIDFCYDNKVRVIVNPAPAVCLPADVLNKIWMITPNESELELLTDISVNNKFSGIDPIITENQKKIIYKEFQSSLKFLDY